MNWFTKILGGRQSDSRRLKPESDVVISCDDRSITARFPNKTPETLLWTELQKVEIVTTDDGPWACDWYWVLHGLDSGIAVPQGATGEKELLQQLQKLPGFDNGAILQAAPRTDKYRVTCWDR